MPRATALRVGLASTLLGLACLVTVGAQSAAPAAPSGFKLYFLHIVARGEGYAHAKGAQPIDADIGGLDTATGDVRSKFYAQTVLKIRINPKTGKVGLPYPKPGHTSVPLDGEYSKVWGSWDGTVAADTENKGGYSCSYSASSTAFKGLQMIFTFDGVPSHGTVPITFGINQPQQFSTGNPKVNCSGYESGHDFPGAGTLQTGAFLRLIDAAPKADLSVKKLLRKDGLVMEVPWKVVTGSCDGCPLPMLPTDGATVIIYVAAELSTRR